PVYVSRPSAKRKPEYCHPAARLIRLVFSPTYSYALTFLPARTMRPASIPGPSSKDAHMARNGLSLVLFVLFHGIAAADDKITNTLAVQAALKQGREHLLRSDYQNAVHVLESQITRIDGSS